MNIHKSREVTTIDLLIFSTNAQGSTAYGPLSGTRYMKQHAMGESVEMAYQGSKVEKESKNVWESNNQNEETAKENKREQGRKRSFVCMVYKCMMFSGK